MNFFRLYAAVLSFALVGLMPIIADPTKLSSYSMLFMMIACAVGVWVAMYKVLERKRTSSETGSQWSAWSNGEIIGTVPDSIYAQMCLSILRDPRLAARQSLMVVQVFFHWLRTGVKSLPTTLFWMVLLGFAYDPSMVADTVSGVLELAKNGEVKIGLSGLMALTVFWGVFVCTMHALFVNEESPIYYQDFYTERLEEHLRAYFDTNANVRLYLAPKERLQ
ncbi:TPA: hypothetical protein ACHP02_005744 [Pseudomonas aeruginosa]